MRPGRSSTHRGNRPSNGPKRFAKGVSSDDVIPPDCFELTALAKTSDESANFFGWVFCLFDRDRVQEPDVFVKWITNGSTKFHPRKDRLSTETATVSTEFPTAASGFGPVNLNHLPRKPGHHLLATGNCCF